MDLGVGLKKCESSPGNGGSDAEAAAKSTRSDDDVTMLDHQMRALTRNDAAGHAREIVGRHRGFCASGRKIFLLSACLHKFLPEGRDSICTVFETQDTF